MSAILKSINSVNHVVFINTCDAADNEKYHLLSWVKTVTGRISAARFKTTIGVSRIYFARVCTRLRLKSF